jgi:hypothetical protein
VVALSGLRAPLCAVTGTCDIVNRKNGTSCDDGNKCTVKDVCTAGVCAGVPKACTGGQCVSKTCNPATGERDHKPHPRAPCNVPLWVLLGTVRSLGRVCGNTS